MADAFHQWGSDLATGSTGDISTISGQLLGQQRVLRRLLTNPGEYIWQLDYGAGLARFIGQLAATIIALMWWQFVALGIWRASRRTA